MAITKKQLTEKTKELILQISEYMEKNIDKAIDNGSMNLEDFDDNYLLPKILVGALLQHEEWQYKTHNKKDAKLVKNIYYSL